MIYVDDHQSAVIRTLTASSTQEESCARERLSAAGIDPETSVTFGHNPERARKMPYLDYLQALLPQQRREAIFYLSDLAWGDGHEQPLGFFGHPKLAPELARLEIRDLGISDRCHQVGPVEFAGGQCTAPIWYPLYGGGDGPLFDEDGNLLFEGGSLGYYVEVHILAGIGNKPGGGGDIWVKDLWFRIENIDEPPSDTLIPLLVP
jgi:hypothetical protein